MRGRVGRPGNAALGNSAGICRCICRCRWGRMRIGSVSVRGACSIGVSPKIKPVSGLA